MIEAKQSLTGELTFGTKNVYPSLIDLEVTPSKEEQVFNHEDSYGYDNVVVNAVTNEIDSNIQPDNIKYGVTILGVTGTIREGNSISVEESTLVFSSGNVEEGELIL